MHLGLRCGYLGSRQRGRGRTLAGLGWLADVLAHAQHAIDLAAFLDEQALGVYVAMNDAGGLKLHPLFGVDRAAPFAADDRFAADDVAFHFPAPRDEDLLGGAHRPATRSLGLPHHLAGVFASAG